MSVALDDDGLSLLREALRAGDYDGADIMRAWLAVDELRELRAAFAAEHAQRIALQHHAADQAQRVADLGAEIERITEAGRAHIRRAAAFEAQRDELAAWKAKIEAQPPVAWQSRFTDGGGWGHCSERHAQMVEAAPHEWPGYEVRALFARPAPVAASDHCEDAREMVCATSGPGGFPKGGAA